MKKMIMITKSKNKTKPPLKVYVFLMLFFIVANVFSENSYSQSKIKLDFKNTKIKKIISFIENETAFRFLYRASEVDLKREVSIEYYGEVHKAVYLLFNNSPVYPIIVNEQIILKRRIGLLQKELVSGNVKDSYGNPLEGVTVIINNNERGTTTDSKGFYSIEAKKDDNIFFSFVGFKTKKIIVEAQKVINVVLKEEIDVLEEVVLIGYGTQKRESVSASISSIKSASISSNLQSGATFDRGLEGLAKGVLVTQGTGILGKNPDIIIRGVTSPFYSSKTNYNNNNPLFVIDGVPITTGDKQFNPLQAISPEDIESVDILKDAGATAMYGSRGANGVIIVKTKKGKYNQKTTATVSFRTTLATPIGYLKFLNAKEFKNYIFTLNKNSLDYYKRNRDWHYEYRDELDDVEDQGVYGIYLDYEDNDGNAFYKMDNSKIKFYDGDTDWSKKVYRNAALTTQANVSITGGEEHSAYGLSLGYINQEGLLKADEKKQYNARFNSQFNFGEKLKIASSISYSNGMISSGYNRFSEMSESREDVAYLGSEVLKFRPDMPVYDEKGELTKNVVPTGSGEEYYYPNPLGVTKFGNKLEQKNHTVLANIFAEYDVTNTLMLKVDYSFMFNLDDIENFTNKKYALSGYGENSGVSSLSINNLMLLNNTINYTLNYTKSINSKHYLKGIVGFLHNNESKYYRYSKHTGFEEGFSEPQFANKTEQDKKSTYRSGINSYIGRLSYDYENKYGVMGTLRYDRSSKLAPKNRGAYFPSMSMYWNIHNESFIKNNFIRELKLRGSYGFTGSINVGDFAYIQTYEGKKTERTLDYNGRPSTILPDSFTNFNLNWERTEEYNVGLDFILKNNLLRGSVDLYHKTTSDVISDDVAMLETGSRKIVKNNATIENKGFEISVGSDIVRTENFSWSLDINASKNLNKVVKLSNEISSDELLSRNYIIGREVNVIKGYVVEGIIQSKQEIKELNDKASKTGNFYHKLGTGPGDYKYKDINGNGRIDQGDMTVIGSTQPELFGGIRTNLRYKDFSLGLNFSYAYGVQSLRTNTLIRPGVLSNIQRHMAPKYRWSPTNRNATLPKLVHRDRDKDPNSLPSTKNVFDASYLRLTAVKLGYNLPVKKISKLRFNSINVFISGTNLITFTKFPGIDPQGTVFGRKSDLDVTNVDAYPSAKAITLGVSLNF